MRNTIDLFVYLRSRDRLKTVAEYNQQTCYSLTSNVEFLVIDDYFNKKSTKSWKKRLNMIAIATTYAVSIASKLAKSFSFTANQFVNSIVSIVSTIQQPLSTTIDFQLKIVLFNDIIVYEFSNVATQLTTVIDEFPIIWNDQSTTVDISKEQWMSINLKFDVSVKSAKVYSISAKNRKIIDKIFDKMHVDDKMIWFTQSIAFSFFIFVIWRDTLNDFKKRVVVNIKDFNKITKQNTYFMSLQTNITSAVTKHRYIFTIDAVKWFHQFLVKRRDRLKFTVVSYKEQKEFNVTLMNFKDSSPYVQRQTNQMLRPYRKFSRAYMNDIIIFFKKLEDHIQHLRSVFQLFQKRRMNLTSIKFFLKYSFITLLSQKINSLKLFTTAKKIIVIISFQFSTSLRELKYFLNFIEWFRHCIERYVQLIKSLQVKKTALIKQLTIDVNGSKSFESTKKKQSSKLALDNVIDEERKTFVKLQNIFFNSIFLIHYDSERSLFVNFDAFKRWDFVVMIYHIADDSKNDIFARTAVQSILFFNKLLNEAEINYWFIELKVADIVWIVKHIKHMIDSFKQSLTIIYIDHSAAVFIFRQTTLVTFNTNKLNLRLIRASQYLFNFNIVIRHKTDKVNIVSNALFRLSEKRSAQSNFNDKTDVLNVLYDHFVKLADHELCTVTIQNLLVITYHVTLIEMFDDFKNRLKLAYEKNKYWKKMLKIITFKNIDHAENSQSSSTEKVNLFSSVKKIDNQSSTEKISLLSSSTEKINQPSLFAKKIISESVSLRNIRFRLKNDFIYYTFKIESKNRLCISTFMKHEVFRIAHDLNSHNEFHRIYDRLVSSIYIRQLTKRLSVYIEYCPQCQLN